MWGAIVGDVIGSRFEFNNGAPIGSSLVAGNSTITDETIIIVALAEAVSQNAPIEASLRRWCKRYRNLSYGNMFYKWFLDSGSVPYQSMGNGAVPRVFVANHFAPDCPSALSLTKELVSITHNHPESLRVTEALSLAHFELRDLRSKQHLVKRLKAHGFSIDATKEQLLRSQVEFSESVVQIVEPALQAVVAGEDFEDIMRICIQRGGDVDSICSMAGGFAELVHPIPEEITQAVIAKLPDDVIQVVRRIKVLD